VFLLDVDNTLLNNDRLKQDVAQHLQELLGADRSTRFWQLYEEVRTEREFVDYPLTIERLDQEYAREGLRETLRSYLFNLPFAGYLYPGALEAIRYLKSFGLVAILSDGDPVFQPLKIRKCGLESAVDGHVMIFVHKEHELPSVFTRYPADHYVVVDDKPRILSALERFCPTEFTTVLVMQGKYATPDDYSPRPDDIVPSIADVCGLSLDQLTGVA